MHSVTRRICAGRRSRKPRRAAAPREPASLAVAVILASIILRTAFVVGVRILAARRGLAATRSASSRRSYCNRFAVPLLLDEDDMTAAVGWPHASTTRSPSAKTSRSPGSNCWFRPLAASPHTEQRTCRTGVDALTHVVLLVPAQDRAGDRCRLWRRRLTTTSAPTRHGWSAASAGCSPRL
jgi:hypothetical protein